MKIFLSLVAWLFVQVSFLLAQPPPVLPNDPSQAPIDGGLSLVALAGSAYAWKKLKAAKK
jgi:hypothetical protein